MRDLNHIAPELFDKIRARFPSVSVGDEEAKATSDFTQGRFFNFDFIINQRNFGNVTISLSRGRSGYDKKERARLTVYFSRGITQKLNSNEREIWYDFLRNIRMFAKSSGLMFDARDITRDHLTINDLKTSIVESREKPLSRVLVSRVTKEGRDFNKIATIYVENSQKERFKLPINNLSYARALVPHLESGGNIYDSYGTHIRQLVQEKRDLERFTRYGSRADYLSESGQHLVSEAQKRSKDIGRLLRNLSNDKYYQTYYNDKFADTDEPLDENLVKLRELFVRPTVDPRVETALPHLGKLSMVTEFEQWVNNVEESVADVVDNEQQLTQLNNIFSEELPLGADGVNAIAAIQDLINSKDLEDQLSNAADQDPDGDARPIVYNWLEQNLPQLTKILDYSEKVSYTNER